MGGNAISIEDTPWIAAILNERGKQNCGGAIYDDRVIVTAAHCLEGLVPQDLRVRIGSSNKTDGGILLNVDRFIIHKDYDKKSNFSVDIGVLLLSSSINLKDNANVKPIELAKTAPDVGTQAFLSGWGRTGYGETDVLKGVTIDIVDMALCEEEHPQDKLINELLCAGRLGSKDACVGDSGSPLVANGKLIGVVSTGPECPHNTVGGVYANVAVLHDWIVANAKVIRNLRNY
ncbi:trypsin beta-like [Scaptodrosophila lebanonensis]|uniref:Trypsin beta-like n=1 Tax=Drosophila lebanonensis TaxID=7225 RepID=A0A6J2U650_DROLE|nr:trypsin beta-like [Scaptodrosophila lebanonensis]